MELEHLGSRRQPEPHTEGLPARAARTQPTGGRPADATLELGLAGVEGIAERGVPRKLLSRDRVQLEQPPHQRPRIVAGEIASLDQRDRVREVGERQATSKARAVRALGGIRGRDQLAGGPTPQATAPAELLCLRHDRSLETRSSP